MHFFGYILTSVITSPTVGIQWNNGVSVIPVEDKYHLVQELRSWGISVWQHAFVLINITTLFCAAEV